MNPPSVGPTASRPYRRLPVNGAQYRNHPRRLAACETAGWATCATTGGRFPLQQPSLLNASLSSVRPGSWSVTRFVWNVSLLSIFLVASSAALACRYSVRDTGFVDLGADPYRLILHLAPDALPLRRADFEQSAAAVLLDANITFSASASEDGSPSRLVLRSPDQRELALAGATAPSLPSSRASIVELLERAVSSPARTQLHDDLLRAYAVLVFVEGQDLSANRRARQTLDEAIAAITRLLPEMPKPVNVPPRILAIPAPSIAAESVLIWGLGMNPQPTQDPRVAVVFGRGRRVGEPLEGGLITRTVLQDRLAIIGQDCECDLDRSSLQGPVIPARWDTARQRAAANALGFDPENPLIRAEISRIVLKGPAKPGASRTTSGAFDALALGYSEEPIEAAATIPADTTEEPVAEEPTAALTSKPFPKPPAPAAGLPVTAGVLALWTTLSGFGLVIALAGAWLLNRSRRDRS